MSHSVLFLLQKVRKLYCNLDQYPYHIIIFLRSVVRYDSTEPERTDKLLASMQRTLIVMNVCPVGSDLGVNSSSGRRARKAVVVLMLLRDEGFWQRVHTAWPFLSALQKLHTSQPSPGVSQHAHGQRFFVHSTTIDMQISLGSSSFFFCPLPAFTVPVSDRLMDPNTKPLSLEGDRKMFVNLASNESMREERTAGLRQGRSVI